MQRPRYTWSQLLKADERLNDQKLATKMDTRLEEKILLPVVEHNSIGGQRALLKNLKSERHAVTALNREDQQPFRAQPIHSRTHIWQGQNADLRSRHTYWSQQRGDDKLTPQRVASSKVFAALMPPAAAISLSRRPNPRYLDTGIKGASGWSNIL
jgi:hypothetical protein